MVHPKFLSNTLYVMGDSYSGLIIPIVVQEISDGNLHNKQEKKKNFHFDTYWTTLKHFRMVIGRVILL
jgi:hypothetical protein